MCLDAAIAGGGPAGAVAALLLARAGLKVALADMPARPRVEGLAPRAAHVLERLGLSPDGIGPETPRTVRWGAMTGAPNRERIVDRAAFDASLRAAAAEAGVAVVAAPVARLVPGRGLVLADGRVLAAPLLFDARGRRAVRGLSGPPSLSIAGRIGVAEGTGAAVTAMPEGWLWRADRPDLGAWAQVTVDAGAARAGLRQAWAAVAGALPFPERPAVRAAALRRGEPCPAPGVLALGDAALALDPLSGHGMFWALSGALAAPALAEAVLGGREPLARRFLAARTEVTFFRQARLGRDLHAASGFDGPFWRARAAWPDAEPAHPPVSAPVLRRQVVLAAGRLAEAEALVTADHPEGAAFAFGQPIAPALRRLAALPPALRADPARALPDMHPQTAAALTGWLASRGAFAMAATPTGGPR